jgi:hypothetical protein
LKPADGDHRGWFGNFLTPNEGAEQPTPDSS